jgi:MFS family permease
MTSSITKFDGHNPSNIQINGKLLLIISITLVSILGIVSINPVLPTIAQDLRIPTANVGLIMTAFLIPTTIGTLFFGTLADRIGKKKVLIPSLLVFGIGGILCASANSFRSLLEWRFLSGLGSASLESVELALISDLYSGKALTSVMGLNSAMIGVASAIYPLIGGMLGALSWRYVFLLSVSAIPLAFLIATRLKLPENYNTTSAQKINTKSYVINTLKSINNPKVFGLLLTIFSMFIVEFGVSYSYVPIYAGKVLGASSTQIGIIFSLDSIAFAIIASQLGLLARNISEKKLVCIGFVLCGLSTLIIPTIHNPWFLIFPCVLFGSSQALVFPSLQAMLASIAPSGYRSGFMALNVTVQSFGRAVGPILGGCIYGIFGIQGVFYGCFLLTIFTTIIFNFLVSSRKTRKSS